MRAPRLKQSHRTTFTAKAHLIFPDNTTAKYKGRHFSSCTRTNTVQAASAFGTAKPVAAFASEKPEELKTSTAIILKSAAFTGICAAGTIAAAYRMPATYSHTSLRKKRLCVLAADRFIKAFKLKA